MPAITFREIDADNWLTCVRLTVGPEQTDFVASNVFSLAQAAYQRQPRLIPLGVCQIPHA